MRDFRLALPGIVFAALCQPVWAQEVPKPVPGEWRLMGQLEAAPGERFGPLSVSLSGEMVAGMLWDGAQGYRGRVWSLPDGLAIGTMDEGFASLVPLRFADNAYDPRAFGARVYAHSRRQLRAWEITGGAPFLVQDFPEETLALGALHDGYRNRYLVGAEIGALSVFDGADGRLLGRIEADSLRPHLPVAMSEDGRETVVASAGFTLTLRAGDVPNDCGAEDCEEAYYDVPGSYGPYEALLAYSPRTGRLASLPYIDAESAASDSPIFRNVAEPTIRLWEDMEDWSSATRPVVEITGFAAPLRYGEFDRDGRLLLTLDESGALAVWNVENGARVLGLDDQGVRAAHFVPGQPVLFIHRGEGGSALVALDTGAVVQALTGPAAEAVFSGDGRVMVTYAPGEGPALLWRLL